ncbi:MAG: hypothetical protein OHK0029_22480 [Armatimonadaceae bacterium]
MVKPFRKSSCGVYSGGNRRGFAAGFTLIEVLVTIVLIVLALVGVLGGIRALNATDVKARDADLLQRLAQEKYNELTTVTDPRTTDDSGDFTEQGYPEITWTVEVEPSGAENVDQVTITTTRNDNNNSQTLTGLVFIPPATTAPTANPAAGTAP